MAVEVTAIGEKEEHWDGLVKEDAGLGRVVEVVGRDMVQLWRRAEGEGVKEEMARDGRWEKGEI